MPLEVIGRDLEEISLPTEGEWVKVLKVLGKPHQHEIAMRTAARARVLGMAFPLDPTDPVLQTESMLCTLSVAIRAWSWKESITLESVRGLDDDSQAVIFARLQELYPAARDEAAERDLSAPGASTSAPAESPQASSAGSQ